MTYLDLVISGLYYGLTLVWPISGDSLVTRLALWATDPAFGPLLKPISAVGAGIALILNREISTMLRGAILAAKRRQEGSARLLFAVALGAAPLVLLDFFPVAVPTAGHWLSAILLLLSGIAILIADKLGVTVRDLDHISVPTYLSIGIAQAIGSVLGLAPQIVTLVLARLMGCERDQAARMSLLLPIPHLLLGLGAFAHDLPHLPKIEIIVIGAIAFVVSLLAASFLLAWLRRKGFEIFAAAQIAIGAAALLGVARFG